MTAALPFLSNLGVNPLHQAKAPTADQFPPAFNQNNRNVWTQAVLDLIPSGDGPQDWGTVIRRYVDLCTARGLFPFQNQHVSRNDQIVDYLRDRRRAFVRFVNQTGFFKDMAIRSTHRHVTVTDAGFVLTVYGKATIMDPSFVQWLVKIPLPAFSLIRSETGRHTKQLVDGINVFVENEGTLMSGRWHVGYDIQCPYYPDLPNDGAPSKAELERFILDVLWMPVLRSQRPLQTMYRLI